MSVFIGKNKQGEIVFIRQDEDGTLVILTCEDLDSLDELAGPVIVPRRIEDTEEDDGHSPKPGSFPLALLETHQPAADTALRIDISDLPQGLLLFNPAKLATHGLALLESGKAEVRLDEDSAGAFGFTKVLSERRMEPGV